MAGEFICPITHQPCRGKECKKNDLKCVSFTNGLVESINSDGGEITPYYLAAIDTISTEYGIPMETYLSYVRNQLLKK